ncbi:MAG: hypothetical protein LUC88_00285 [Prevotella sp.]|nr:hypothetical protein [Prevotella sp.]
MIKYYITPKELAEKIGMTSCRKGNDVFYICHSGDFAAYGLQKAIADGAVEISLKDAKKLIKDNNL